MRDFRNFQTVVMLKRFLILGILLHVTCVPSQLFGSEVREIYVRYVNGNVVTLDVEASDSIQNVKQKVWDKAGIPPDFQKLFFAGTLLEDARTLADYNIQWEDSINFVLSKGTMDFLNAVSSSPYTLHSGYDIKLLDTASTVEVWNSFALSSSLTISPSGQTPYVFNILAVDGVGALSSLSNFSYATGFTLPVVTAAGGIINFNPTQVSVNTSGFSNSLGGGSFSLVQSNCTTLSLQFTPGTIPEPSTYGFCGLGAIGLMFFLRRKKSNQS